MSYHDEQFLYRFPQIIRFMNIDDSAFFFLLCQTLWEYHKSTLNTMNIKLKLAKLPAFCKILELLLATSSLQWLNKKGCFLFYLPNQRHAFLIPGLGYSKFSSPYLLLTVDGYTPLHMGS